MIRITNISQKKVFSFLVFVAYLFLSLLSSTGIVHSETTGSGENSGKELFKKNKRVSSVIYFVSDADSIPADGETSAALTVLMENKKGKPLKGIKLGFSIASGEGTLSANTATTDANGRATITLISSTEGSVLVLAKTKNILPKKKKFLSIDVTEIVTANLTLLGNKTSIAADGTSTATFTALLKTDKNNPIPGGVITFQAEKGTITSSAVTDSSGVATATLTSEKGATGTVQVTATYNDINATAEIEFTEVEKSITLVLSADKTSISADGLSTSTIKALLRNEKNNPIIGATIEFATEKGTIPASATTNSSGVAAVDLISENYNGDVIVTASYNDIETTITIEFVAAGVFNMAIAASPTNITADGTEAATISITLTDANGDPISGQEVDFRNALDVDGDGTISVGDTLDYGTLSATTGTTDNDGVGTTTLTSSSTGSIVVEADVSGITRNVTIDAVAAGEVKSVVLVSDDESILVNTGSTTITATFTNITSGNAIFTTSLGDLSSNVNAIGLDGVVTTTLTAGDLTGIAVVKVSYYDSATKKRIEDTMEVTITSDTPASIIVTASPDNIHVGAGQSVITAFVKDNSGNPVSNIEVGFVLVNKPGGTETLDSSMAITDANGKASVNFLAGELTTPLFNGVKINAYVASNPLVVSTTFLTISGSPYHVAIVFNDYGTTIFANGDGTLTCPISALVTDIHGNPVADGTVVSFGVATTQIVALESDIGFDVNGDSDTVDKVLISSEDINGSGGLDSGEDLNGNRVVDIIEDINGNGELDSDEDTNQNGVLDDGEDANANGLLDINEDINGNVKLDVNISADAIATTSSETVDGVAVGELTYGANFVERFQVRLTAESGGMIDRDGQYLVLPARDPDTGYNITWQPGFITNTNIDPINLPAPSDLTATAFSSSQIDLTWTDNSSAETAFSIERKGGNLGSFSEIATVAADSTSYSDTGLDANTPYYYRVRALNQAESQFSAFSSEATATTLNESPDAPTDLQAEAVSTNQVNLSWDDNSLNESVFALSRATSIAGPFTEIATVNKNVISYSDTDVSKNTTYYYKVAARNSAGDSSSTNIASVTTPDSKPVAPTGLAANVSLSSGIKITLTWTDNSDNEVGFSIERASQGSNFAEIATTESDATSFIDDDTSIVSGKIYYYRIRGFGKGALAGGGANSFSDYSQEVSANTLVETQAPNTPANLSATASASTQVDLTWSDNSLNETSFAVSRATSSGGPYTEIGTVGKNLSDYSDTTVSNDTTYYYKVVARNAFGDSGASNIIVITTPDIQPVAPSGLAAVAVIKSRLEIVLSWTDNSSNEVGFAIERATKTTSGIGSYSTIFTTEANATSYTDDDTALVVGNTYYYRIRAFAKGALYSVYSQEISVAPLSISAPTVLTGVGGVSSVTLSWTDNSNNETGFTIEYKTSSSAVFTEQKLAPANATSFAITGLTTGTTYVFRVRAFSGTSYSDYTNEFAVTAN